jgi:hypothetical protein
MVLSRTYPSILFYVHYKMFVLLFFGIAFVLDKMDVISTTLQENVESTTVKTVVEPSYVPNL